MWGCVDICSVPHSHSRCLSVSPVGNLYGYVVPTQTNAHTTYPNSPVNTRVFNPVFIQEMNPNTSLQALHIRAPQIGVQQHPSLTGSLTTSSGGGSRGAVSAKLFSRENSKALFGAGGGSTRR